MVALSFPPVGFAYYRVGTYGTATPTPAVTGLQSREEVRRSVHALTTSTVGVSLLQSLTEHIVVGATPKIVCGSAARGEATDCAGARRAGTRGLTRRVWQHEVRRRCGCDVRDAALQARVRGAQPDDAGVRRRWADGIEAIELSREVRAGAAWGSTWPGLTRLVVAVDADLVSRATPFGDRRDVAVGVETWWLAQRLGVRGGVRRSTIGESRAAATAGVSAGLKPGMLIEAHAVRGQKEERGWSVGVRAGF